MLLDILRGRKIERVRLDLRVKDLINEGSPDFVKLYMKTEPDIGIPLDIGTYKQTLSPGLLNSSSFKVWEELAITLGTKDILGYFMPKDSVNPHLSHEDQNQIIRQFLVNAADINPEIKGEKKGITVVKVGEHDFDLSKMKSLYDKTSGIHKLVGDYE